VLFHRESASTTASSSALKIDGRRLRSERTRLAIIEAYLELLRRNSVMPTAAQLADQAGCSVRDCGPCDCPGPSRSSGTRYRR